MSSNWSTPDAYSFATYNFVDDLFHWLISMFPQHLFNAVLFPHFAGRVEHFGNSIRVRQDQIASNRVDRSLGISSPTA